MKRKNVGFQGLDESLTKFFRMMRIVLLVICAVVFTTAGAYAQNKTLKGTVTDGTGVGLPGVTVAVKGTTVGTITDIDGKFSLAVPATSRTLQFSFVGMATQEIAIGNQTTFNITMKDETKALQEVVVVGFGSQKKESVVGSIVTATQESLKKTGSPTNLMQALTGQLAGVTTIQSTGEPGNDDPRILIRAQGTWNNSQPLILVDGIERKMSDLDISEVESISVLKDASATAVFGVKGSEGVILITTKRGQLGKPRLTVEANVTLKQISKTPNKLNSYDGISLANKAIEHELPTYEGDWSKFTPDPVLAMYHNHQGYDRNSFIPDNNHPGQYLPYTYAEVFPDVDWAKENVKSPFAISNRVNLNVSGGTDFAKYFGSFAYTHDADMLKSSMVTTRPYKTEWAYDRFNFRSNLDFNMTKTTIFSVNISGYVGVKHESFNVNDNAGFWNGLYNTPPNAFIPRFSDGYWGFTTVAQIKNPVANLNQAGNETLVRTQVSTDFTLKQNLDFITQGLSATASLSFDTRFNTSGGVAEFNGGGGFSRYVDWRIINMKPGETPDTYTYGSNRATGPLGFDYIEQPVNWLAESAQGTGGQNTGVDYWGNAMTPPYRRLYYKAQLDYARKFGKHDLALTGVVDREEYANGSEFPRYREDWIGRVTYNYDGRYFLEANGAYNGSEKFAKKYRFGFFPSVGGSWVLSNEKWLKKQWLDKLKIRYNVGLVGDDGIGTRWGYMSIWNTDATTTRFGLTPSGSPYTQYYEGTIGNPNLHWEISKKQNYGFEAAVFKNLINVNIDYFTDDRKDIFMSAGQRSVAPFWGPSAVAGNLGKTHTQGYEIELKFQKTIGKANYWLNTAFTHAKDKILYMEDPEGYYDYQKSAGFQIGQTKTILPVGYVNNWDDIYAMTPYSTNKTSYLPGDLQSIDWNGDGLINTSDNSDQAPWAFPQSRPQNTYNYSLGVDVKGWSFMVQFYGVNNVIRQQQVSYSDPFSDGGLYSKIFVAQSNGWTPENLDASWKALRVNNNTVNGTLFMVDGSYFRLKTAEIAYTFQDKGFLKRLGLNSLRVYCNGNNLWLVSKMWDDREDNSGEGYPVLKRINLGLTLNF